MKMYEHSNYISIFGDRSAGIVASELRSIASVDAALHEKLKIFFHDVRLKALVIAHQVHGVNGVIITSLQQVYNSKLLEPTGDFVITDIPKVMVGVLTADCLPVTVYDKNKQVVGVAHAGWRGSVAGILDSMIDALEKKYTSNIQDLQFQFGPCAHVCCYQVDQLFVDVVSETEEGSQALAVRDGKFYFNLPLYNQLQLKLRGVLIANIDMSSSICTICDVNYYSYRRDKTALRQISVVSLK